ncbi:AAA family ATPase [Vibrio splendidus]|uniref:AAA family ATPase n=1 Tax=Vibrio splendidus TaxID=29497 RepID=UPI00352E4D41
MKFHIENLGKIKQADIELKDLTIICGPNSSNKTWLSYFINHSLLTSNNYFFTLVDHLDDRLKMDLTSLLEDGSVSINLDKYEESFKRAFELSHDRILERLPQYFNLSKDTFEKTDVSIDVSNFGYDKSKEVETENRRVRLTKKANSSIVNIELLQFSNTKIVRSFMNLLVRNSALMSIANLFVEHSSLKPFSITSERTGCMVFQPEIDSTAIKVKSIFEEMEEFILDEEIPAQLLESLEEVIEGTNSYAGPVRQNLNTIRNAKRLMLKESVISERYPEVGEALNRVNGGKFTYSNSQLSFTTDDGSSTLPVTISSSSVKSLFLLDLYIKHIASPGDLLLIDEPELNLHPDNQRLISRAIARLVNSGVKVLITTHSDYLIREINNSIMLSNEFDEKEAIMQSHDFKQSDILKPTQVSAYMVENEGNKAVVSEMKVGQLGINTQIFDCIINSANQLQSEIYFNLDDVDE